MTKPNYEAPEHDFHPPAPAKKPNDAPLDGGAHHDIPAEHRQDPLLSKIAQRAIANARGGAK